MSGPYTPPDSNQTYRHLDIDAGDLIENNGLPLNVRADESGVRVGCTRLTWAAYHYIIGRVCALRPKESASK